MKQRFIVAVYREDRAYGGPEEGGWYYTHGSLVRILRVFRDETLAEIYASRMNRKLDAVNARRPSIGSVLSKGRYTARVCEDNAPAQFPELRPYYE